jgi:hypothetical protein
MEEMSLEQLRDPLWRLSNLYKIKTKKGDVITFKPNAVQQEFIKNHTGRDIVLKSRQQGISTLILLILLDKVLFSPNRTAVILAHTDKSVQRLFRTIRFAYDNIDPKLLPIKPEAKYDNKQELFFQEINSTIYVALSVRGDSVNYLHVSELAFIPDAEDKMIATFASVPPDGWISIESTANGIGNYFYDFYLEARERGFKAHFYPWFKSEEYRSSTHALKWTVAELEIQKRYGLDNNQLAWYKQQKALYRDKFPQEFPSTALEAFLSAGINVFDIEQLQKNETKDPQEIPEGWLFSAPLIHNRYAMGIDTSEAVGQDEHSIDIIDIETGEQVFHYSGQISFEALVERVKRLNAMFYRPLIVPEANSHGYALVKTLLEEPNIKLYKRKRFDTARRKKENRVGFLTTARTKPMIIEDLNRAIYSDDIIINSEKTKMQMLSFLYLGTGMGAAPGKKDDTVMSLALAWHGVLETTKQGRIAEQRQPPAMNISTSNSRFNSY